MTSKSKGGAEYIDPKMRKSTDFPGWLDKQETKDSLKGKEVLMYCTGGVRCERASALIKKKYGDSIAGVFQLEGGIEKYLQEFPDGGFWNGKNYVFDKREAIGADCVQGVGGVVTKEQKKQLKKAVLGKCVVCKTNWDRFIGKKKCYTCGIPVLMCDSCLSQKPDKTPGKELSVRCPLCVEEKITTPATEVTLADNGVSVARKPNATSAVPSSVCKWGGGHAAGKKTGKKKEREEQRKVCREGKNCRKGPACRFTHPEGTSAPSTKVSSSVSPSPHHNNKKHQLDQPKKSPAFAASTSSSSSAPANKRVKL